MKTMLKFAEASREEIEQQKNLPVAIYQNEFPNQKLVDGHAIDVVWITARTVGEKLPGGAQLIGAVIGNAIDCQINVFQNCGCRASALRSFGIAYGHAWRAYDAAAGKGRRPTSIMRYLQGICVAEDRSPWNPTDGRCKFIFAHTEEEAARKAYMVGCRTDELEPGRYRWQALGLYQRETESKVAAEA